MRREVEELRLVFLDPRHTLGHADPLQTRGNRVGVGTQLRHLLGSKHGGEVAGDHAQPSLALREVQGRPDDRSGLARIRSQPGRLIAADA